MRIVAVGLIAALALAGCGQQEAAEPEAETSAELADAFPDLLQANYRAEATITAENGTTMPVVMIRSGNKLRMEIASPQGEQTIIVNPDTNESFVIAQAGGMRMAMRADASQIPDASRNWSGDVAANATRTGSCSVAGASGSEWTGQDGNVACVTDDGIILRATDNGRVAWETTSISRGHQDPSLFQLPPGVQAMDANSMMGQAMEKMKAQQGR